MILLVNLTPPLARPPVPLTSPWDTFHSSPPASVQQTYILYETENQSMFIYIKHGDNQQFLANINCSVLLLLQYLHNKMGMRSSDLVDLCDEAGTLKLLFQVKLPGESASKFLQDRNVYYICKVQRGPRGTRSENAYRAIVPLLKEPEQDLLDTLKAQCDALEKSRIQKLRDQAAKKIVPKKVHIIEPSKTTARARTPAKVEQETVTQRGVSSLSKNKPETTGKKHKHR
ncbi:LOW QUALITY PROTEIN: uncharacterized protein CXorf65 homolog [Vombatus ursinus]|uniref:LOW QUALITY PROTEIN: uncharacterized protein CXorf65 homolog n=1 Tax=Vombatus ursinus TaxID=29139 RepID=UPI000FFD9BFD|nr:LOW QUALITY PROTEIN: uncharacterized protein CXorf65 homolog [Vombatus ursinus]